MSLDFSVILISRNLHYSWGALTAETQVEAWIDQSESLLPAVEEWPEQIIPVEWNSLWGGAQFQPSFLGQCLLMGFKPQARWWRLAQRLGAVVAANQLILHRQLEDKFRFTRLLQRWGLPQLPFFLNASQRFSPAEFARQTGTDAWVIQTKRGWAGSSSWLVWGADQWHDWQLQHGAQVVKITPYQPQGLTLTVNAVNWPQQTFFSPVAVQITNLDQGLADQPLATVGRSWPARVPASVQRQLYDCLEQLAARLRQLGYLGYWGVDVLWLPGSQQFYILEINPRLTASESFYSRLELAAGVKPLIWAHMLAFVNPEPAEWFVGRNQLVLQGTQVVIKSELSSGTQTGFFFCRSGKWQSAGHEWLILSDRWHVSRRQPLTDAGESLRLETKQILVDDQGKLTAAARAQLDHLLSSMV